MATVKFSKKEAIRFGFEEAKANWPFFIPVVLIAVLVNFSPQLDFKLPATGAIVLAIGFWVLRLVVEIGLITISLKFADNKKAQLADILTYKPFLNYALGSVLYGLIIVAGLILLIIPGIIWAIKLQFYSYLIIDKNLRPVEALKKSWTITKGVKWNLFLFALLAGLINILGVLALGVGLFISIPTTMIASAKVYRKLSS